MREESIWRPPEAEGRGTGARPGRTARIAAECLLWAIYACILAAGVVPVPFLVEEGLWESDLLRGFARFTWAFWLIWTLLPLTILRKSVVPAALAADAAEAGRHGAPLRFLGVAPAIWLLALMVSLCCGALMSRISHDPIEFMIVCALLIFYLWLSPWGLRRVRPGLAGDGLAPRRILMGAAAAALCAVMVVDWDRYARESRRVVGQLSNVERDINELRAIATHPDQFEAELAQLEEEVSKLRARLPAEPRLASFVTRLDSRLAAQGAGLDVHETSTWEGGFYDSVTVKGLLHWTPESQPEALVSILREEPRLIRWLDVQLPEGRAGDALAIRFEFFVHPIASAPPVALPACAPRSDALLLPPFAWAIEAYRDDCEEALGRAEAFASWLEPLRRFEHHERVQLEAGDILDALDENLPAEAESETLARLEDAIRCGCSAPLEPRNHVDLAGH